MKKYLKTEKLEAKKKESSIDSEEKNDPEIAHSYSTRRNRHNPDELELILPLPEEGRKVNPRPPKEKMNILTYEELKLPPISTFDYRNYEKVHSKIFRIGVVIVVVVIQATLPKVLGDQKLSALFTTSVGNRTKLLT